MSVYLPIKSKEFKYISNLIRKRERERGGKREEEDDKITWEALIFIFACITQK